MGPGAPDSAAADAPDAGRPRDDLPRGVVRVALGLFLGLAGVSHFLATDAFRAQVPPWMPAPNLVIWVSGVIEIVLGLALVAAPARRRAVVGWLTAAFLVVVFPGNVSQWVTGTDAFGLDTDRARAVRLLLQPVLVVAVLWATRAWSFWRGGHPPGARPAVRPSARR